MIKLCLDIAGYLTLNNFCKCQTCDILRNEPSTTARLFVLNSTRHCDRHFAPVQAHSQLSCLTLYGRILV